MPDKELLIARHVAIKKLNDVESLFEELDAERKKLQHIVQALDAYLGDSVDEELTDAEPEKFLVTQERPQPAWMSARDVLAKKMVRMAVPGIHAVLSAQGFVITKDALRIAMLRKPDIFNNDSAGTYGLNAWLVSIEHSDEKSNDQDHSSHMTFAEMKEAHPPADASW